MRYDKGSFITVPNKNRLRGLHPTAQVLYMWLCSYANTSDYCFPSRKTLAKDCNCTDRMIDKMMELLIDQGLVVKTSRAQDNKSLTNLYYVPIIAGPAGGANNVPQGGEHSSLGGGEQRSHRTQSNIELNPINSLAPGEADAEGKAIAEVIYLFKGVNPAYKKFFYNKTQRAAAARLLEMHDLQWWQKFMDGYAKVFPNRYCPKATTPVQLEDNLARIMAYGHALQAGDGKYQVGIV